MILQNIMLYCLLSRVFRFESLLYLTSLLCVLRDEWMDGWMNGWMNKACALSFLLLLLLLLIY